LQPALLPLESDHAKPTNDAARGRTFAPLPEAR
jgi:hypothetical protein